MASSSHSWCYRTDLESGRLHVVSGTGDTPEAVDADDEDGEHGGIAEGVVQHEPAVADHLA